MIYRNKKKKSNCFPCHFTSSTWSWSWEQKLKMNILFAYTIITRTTVNHAKDWLDQLFVYHCDMNIQNKICLCSSTNCHQLVRYLSPLPFLSSFGAKFVRFPLQLGIFPLPSFVTLTADILIFPAKFCYAFCRYDNISHCRCQNGLFGFIFIPFNLHHILQRICYIVFNLFCSPGPVTKDSTKDLFPRGLTFSATKDLD